MEKPLVSIIIPFYNPIAYFNEMLESVSNQSYDNIEVILIDDGSKDIYHQIGQEFVKLAANRIMITRENGGVASARQAGVDISTGEFIIHADADDILPEDSIELLVDKVLKEDSDIVVGGYIVKSKDKEVYIEMDELENFWGFAEGLLTGTYHGSLCNKLINRNLYNEVSFESGLDYMEDKLILAKMFRNGPCNISFLNKSVYIYRQNSNSVTYNLSLKSIESSKRVNQKIIDLYNGIFKDEVLNRIERNQRLFEIYQSAKKGLNIFTDEDVVLIKDIGIPLRYRVFLWLLSKDLSFTSKLLIITRKFIK